MSKLFEAKLAVFLSMVALYFSVVWSVILSDAEMALWAIVALIFVVGSMIYLDEVGRNG